LGLVVLMMAGGGVAWVERAELRAWWVLRGLRQAGDGDRDAWVAQVADLGEPAVDGLLDCLDGDDRARHNAAAALSHLALTWGADDPRTADLAARLARGYGRLCPQGQACLLCGMAGWLDDKQPSAGFVSACSRLLSDSAGGDDEALGGALELSMALLKHPQTCEATRSAREAARAGLRSSSSENRLRAVRLGLLPGVDLLDEIAGLLRDSDVRVRRAAVVAVGPSEQAVPDEGLLPCLHDSDGEVRRLAEEALKGRGLRPDHLRLGKLLTHPVPAQRLLVLNYLSEEGHDLDVGLWLRRLSHDPSPAVRVAAVRMMSEQKLIDLTDRIDQIARSDPEPTVAQLARYYLDSAREKRPQ
jgi:HEAT repeat protein